MSGRSAPQASSSSTITACSATLTHSRPLRPLTHRREEGPMRPLTVGTSLVAGIFALGCTDEPPTVRVDPENEQYVVNWKTGQFGLDTAKTYRIRVLLGSTELGHADVDVVATGRERKSVNTAEFVPVINGQTQPITFRIEDGAILALALGAMRTWY